MPFRRILLYSENRPLVPWKAAIDNSVENIKEAYAEIMMGLLTKDKEWEYENEWRILIGAMEELVSLELYFRVRK